MNKMPPWSRRPCTQPISVTARPTSTGAACPPRSLLDQAAAELPSRSAMETRVPSRALPHPSNRAPIAKGTAGGAQSRSTEAHAMVKTGTLTALFHELVRTAMSTQRVATSETTECYLVQLLERFARPDRAISSTRRSASTTSTPSTCPPQRFGRLRRVADTALFVTGVFFDCLERRLVGPDTMRRSAATPTPTSRPIPPHGATGRLVRRAGRPLPGVRPRARRRSAPARCSAAEQDTLRLYKRWLHTRGAARGRPADPARRHPGRADARAPSAERRRTRPRAPPRGRRPWRCARSRS